MKKRLVVLLIIIFLLPFISAVSITYKYYNDTEYQNPITNVQLFVYNCTDESCSSLITPYWNNQTSTGDSNVITITNLTPISQYNKEFHYASCYKVKEESRYLNYYEGSEQEIWLSKEPICSAFPLNLQVEGSGINSGWKVKVNVKEVFNSTTVPADGLPSEVMLYINDTPNQSKDVVVPVNGSVVEFNWTPNAVGTYEIKIKTNVTDCKCSSSEVKEISQVIEVAEAGCVENWTCSEWGPCINNQQNRTCTDLNNCGTTINKPEETRSCAEGGEGGGEGGGEEGGEEGEGVGETNATACVADGLCRLGCTNGDPDCSCIVQGGRICTGNFICPKNFELKAKEQGCCATLCKEYCAVNGEEQYCVPSEDRCALKRVCVNNTWSSCVKIDPYCIRGNACIDGTPSGQCSWRTSGLFCQNGSLVIKPECVNISLPRANISNISNISNVSYGNQTIQVELSPELKAVLKRIAKYLGIAAAISFAIIITLYLIARKKGRIVISEEAEEKLRPVRPSELLLSLIQTLPSNERRICEKLLEGDGIRQDALRAEVGMTKAQITKALSSLEEKQIIKEREDEKNPRIWFNDDLLD